MTRSIRRRRQTQDFSLIGMQRRCTAGVQEQQVLVGAEKPLAAQIDQPGHHLAGIDRVEQDGLGSRQHLHGFDALICHTANPEDLNDGSGRTNKREVILLDRLRTAARRLNPTLPAQAIEDALERDNHMSSEEAVKFGLIDKVVDKRLEDPVPPAKV